MAGRHYQQLGQKVFAVLPFMPAPQTPTIRRHPRIKDEASEALETGWANLKVGYATSAACSGQTTAPSQPGERPGSARQALPTISSEPGSPLLVQAKLAPESESRPWGHTEMRLIERAMQHILMNPSGPSSATSCVTYDSGDTTGGRTPPFDSEPTSTCTTTIQLPLAPRASPCVPSDSPHRFLTARLAAVAR